MKYILITVLILAAIAIIASFAFDEFFSSSGPPDFSILSPQENEIIQDDVTLKLSVKNFQIITPPDNRVLENIPEQGHFHVYLDGNETSYVQINSSVSVLQGISSGVHTMRVSMRQNDHYPIGVEKNISFVITE